MQKWNSNKQTGHVCHLVYMSDRVSNKLKMANHERSRSNRNHVPPTRAGPIFATHMHAIGVMMG